MRCNAPKQGHAVFLCMFGVRDGASVTLNKYLYTEDGRKHTVRDHSRQHLADSNKVFLSHVTQRQFDRYFARMVS